MIYTIAMIKRPLLFFTGCLLFSCCLAQPLAFPGAEGFGKFTTGGRGGKVFIVNNLNDAGEGSFRRAAEANMPRIIVFAVSGTIHLQSKLSIKGNVTVAGQTAPGDGICLADHSVVLGGDNMIIRYLRFRLGDKNQKGGMVDGNGGDDAFGGGYRKNIIIDHCSMSWSTDEVCSVYNGDSTTLQWNIIAEPLNYSYHFETGDKDYERHGYGGIWGGKHLSAHHNLFAHCVSRNPRFQGTRNAPEEFVDYRNNVIYNWGNNNVYGGEGGNYNIVNNYYRFGPSTAPAVRKRIVNPSAPYGNYYVAGNFVEDAPEINADNWRGVHAKGKPGKMNKPFETVKIPEQSAQQAFQAVLKNVGATLPKRDTLDARIIRDVENRTGRIIDVQGGYPHGTDYATTQHAWPALLSKPAPADKDHDGMPDDWEIKHQLNPSNASDASSFTLDKHYTNIEVYINSLVP